MAEVFVFLFLASIFIISKIPDAQPWMLLAVIGMFWFSLCVLVYRSTPKYRYFRFRCEDTEVDMISMRGYDPRHRIWARHAVERLSGCPHGVDWRGIYRCVQCTSDENERQIGTTDRGYGTK